MATKAKLDKALYYYPWYYKDWGSSRKVIKMTLAERGLYRELLDCCWDKGSIPDDPQQLIDFVNCDEDEFTPAWPRVRKCFSINPDGTLFNPKLEEVRAEVQTKRKIQQKSGAKGGAATAKKREQMLSNESQKRKDKENKNKEHHNKAYEDNDDLYPPPEYNQDQQQKQAPPDGGLPLHKEVETPGDNKFQKPNT